MEPRNPQQNEGFFAKAADTIKAAQQAVSAPIDRVTEPFLRDGMLAAAFRQGAGELYEALKPFPQSIQVDEPGAFLNPTQGEIAADRKPEKPSPSEIAKDNSPAPPDPSHERGIEMSRGM